MISSDSLLTREVGFRFSPNGTTQTMTLTSTEIAQIKKINIISLRDIMIPITYYNINESNNFFLLKEGAGSWLPVTLEKGNYSGSQFCAQLKEALEFVGGGTYTITISPISGKLSISVVGVIGFSVAFTTGDRQTEKIWGVPAGTAGGDPYIENPPSASQVVSGLTYKYGSALPLPSVITINSRNNAFILYLTGDLSWTPYTLTNGTYTRVQFAAMLTTVLSAAPVSLQALIYNNGTLVITLTPTLLITDFAIAFLENVRDIEEIWGVPANTPGANRQIQNPPAAAQVNNISSSIYTSLRPVILWGPDQLLLRSAALESITLFKNTDIGTGIQNIVTKIPVSGLAFSQYISTNGPTKQVIANSSLPSSIDINITDESGNNVNFNGGVCYINMVVR